jgi:phosphoglucosamine mutase
MISASHNPYYDNGIKLFGPEGLKLSDQTELMIEERLNSPELNKCLVPSDKLGRAKRLEDAPGRYIEFVKSTFPKGKTLDDLKIVIDCANGAAYNLGTTILWELGAEVIPVAVAPNGFNINEECGSTYPQHMVDLVKKHNADIGIALDGDADRIVIADEQGHIIDGDQIMAVIASCWSTNGRLRGNKVVSTVMSNLAFENYLRSINLELIRTQVGDRYVTEKMRELNANIGGEQSGHIILSDYATTGDGLLAALQILSALVEQGKKASEVCNLFTPLPQIIRSVACSTNFSIEDYTVQKAIKAGEEKLKGTGRLLVRKSGTEPLIRIMAEGEDETLIKQVVENIISDISIIN